MTDTRRRVKLYALNADRQWDDRGTGHVSSSYVDRLKGISLLVRAESDGSLLLESKIQPDTAYQKQQVFEKEPKKSSILLIKKSREKFKSKKLDKRTIVFGLIAGHFDSVVRR